MKLVSTQTSGKAARHSRSGKRCAFFPKVMGKKKKGKKALYEGNRISKLDAQIIVGLMREPFCPNEATIEARNLGKAIHRLSTH